MRPGTIRSSGSVAFVRQEQMEDWVTIEPLPRNGGFAYGNNAAIRPALASDQPPDYVLLLNPDTVVRPGAIPSLLKFLAAHPQVGMAGSRLEDPDGTPQRSAFRFPTIAGELDKTLRFGPVSRIFHRYIVAPPVSPQDTATDWVAGASLLVRREVFEAIGLVGRAVLHVLRRSRFLLAGPASGLVLLVCAGEPRGALGRPGVRRDEHQDPTQTSAGLLVRIAPPLFSSQPRSVVQSRL